MIHLIRVYWKNGKYVAVWLTPRPFGVTRTHAIEEYDFIDHRVSARKAMMKLADACALTGEKLVVRRRIRTTGNDYVYVCVSNDLLTQVFFEEDGDS